MTAPLTPPETNLRGIEAPWQAFVDLAVKQFGISREEAQRLVDEVRAEQEVMQ